MRYTEIKSLEGEEWRPIEGYDGCYYVSNFGRVASHYQKGQGGNFSVKYAHLLKPKLTNCGYYQVTLCLHEKLKYLSVHRLVAAAFIGAIGDGMVFNHLDSNRTNNHVSNLEVTTLSGNTQHAVKAGRLIPFMNPVRAIAVLKDEQVVGEFPRIVDACKELGLNKQCVNHVLHGINKTHKGYTFKYLDRPSMDSST